MTALQKMLKEAELPRKSLFRGRPMHDMFSKPGMSEDSIYQIGKEVDW